jgi:chromosome partitioning protein
MEHIVNEEEFEPTEGILHHAEGVDILPANIELSGTEVSLVNIMSRETILRQYVSCVEGNYDYILVDCMPSLGMITINALACADSVLIPVQAAYLPVKGLEQLIKTIRKVKRQLNPHLEIEGILMTMVDGRTTYAKEIIQLLEQGYGGQIKFFKNAIPLSVRIAEISAIGVSIYRHDPKGRAAWAYQALTDEILSSDTPGREVDGNE